MKVLLVPVTTVTSTIVLTKRVCTREYPGFFPKGVINLLNTSSFRETSTSTYSEYLYVLCRVFRAHASSRGVCMVGRGVV